MGAGQKRTASSRGDSSGSSSASSTIRSRIWGRKRHILTDTDGRLLAVHVHGADVQDRDGAEGVLKRSRARYPFVEHTFADGGYAGGLVEWTKQKTHITLQIMRRNASTKGFEVLPRRWVVERTLAWIIKNRCFVRDYEQLTPVAETLIVIAAAATLTRRWPWGNRPSQTPS